MHNKINFKEIGINIGLIWACFCLISVMACKGHKGDNIDAFSYELGVVGGFSELVNAGVKQLALSAPMSAEEMDAFMPEAQKIAANHDVEIYRESDLIVTDLFPADVAKQKDVLLLFKSTALQQYLNLKADKLQLEEATPLSAESRRDIARRFGRLLSYSPKKINQLLSDNTSFRTMAHFGIQATNLFLYFKDLARATRFYSEILGFELVADYGMASILRMTVDSYIILVDATKGMHSADEPKTVALALLTEQLDQWHTYLQSQSVTIKYDYKPKIGSAHDGFVVEDPEGYLLEFERFNQHPENEKFIPVLADNKSNKIKQSPAKKVPHGLGFHSTITWLYHKEVLNMQQFYEDVLGLEMLVDQGWAKVYQVSKTGFMGIVDERRGMHSYTEKKAVNVGFILDDLESWFKYVKNSQPFDLRDQELHLGPENKYKAFVGYGPEKYYLEFDQFLPHSENEVLLQYLDVGN